MNLQENIYRIREMMGISFTGAKTYLGEKVGSKKVVCKCGWEWDFKDGGEDPYICHKCGHDNSEDLLSNTRD
jgi:hypothetical protein